MQARAVGSAPSAVGPKLERVFELAMAVAVGLASPVAGVVALLALGSASIDVAEVGERLVVWGGAGAGGTHGRDVAPMVVMAAALVPEPELAPAATEPEELGEDASVEEGAEARSPGVEPGPVELGGSPEDVLGAVAQQGPAMDLLGSNHPGAGQPWGEVQHGTGRLEGGGGVPGLASPPAAPVVAEAAPVAGPAGPPAVFEVDAAAGMRFVAIAGGGFWMGSPEGEPGRFDNEGPRHRVHLSPYWLASTEVTRDQWRAVMGSLPTVDRGWGDLPVVGVSWCDALVYANALSEREGLAPVYRFRGPCAHGGAVVWDRAADGYRLPTEAEWELAARGGQAALFAGAGRLELVGWYLGNAAEGAHPVGSLAANAYGLHDMSGNVWEWVWDRLGAYGAEAQDDPFGPDRGSSRILRGGSWRYEARYARVADRNWGRPGYRAPAVGFRLARSLQPGDMDAMVSGE